MQVCTSLQTDKPCQHPTAQFFTGRMSFLPPNTPNQQCQSTEGKQKTDRQTKSHNGQKEQGGQRYIKTMRCGRGPQAKHNFFWMNA